MQYQRVTPESPTAAHAPPDPRNAKAAPGINRDGSRNGNAFGGASKGAKYREAANDASFDASLVDGAEILRFCEAIHALAANAFRGVARPGLMQLTKKHKVEEQNLSVVGRYEIGEAERMAMDAQIEAENGFNVYVEGRTVRPDLAKQKRGAKDDTVGVFALVTDNDAYKEKVAPTVGSPAMVVESSPGSTHVWYGLDRAIPAAEAEGFKALLGADASAVVTQPYRVAGTPNYPSPHKRRDYGRTDAPTRILSTSPVRYTPASLRSLWPQEGGPADMDDLDQFDVLMQRCSPTRRSQLAETDLPNIRSDHFQMVTGFLRGDGFSLDEAFVLWEGHPDGAAGKYEGRLRKELKRSWAKVTDRPEQKTKPKEPPKKPTLISAAELYGKTFEPVRYVVPGYIAEGLTLFAGRPKMGKSWLMYDTSLAVSSGGLCLGAQCRQGDVLYLALEDNQRRLQGRLHKLWGEQFEMGAPVPAGLTLATEWPRANEGGVEAIEEWIVAHPYAVMVIVDVIGAFRAIGKSKDVTQYDADYQAIAALQRLSSKHRIAIIVVHHVKKSDGLGDDPIEKVSGTLGLSGAADTILVLDKKAGNCTLYGRGRDIEEIDTAVTFNATDYRWNALGASAAVHRSDQRSVIIKTLTDYQRALSPAEIADANGLKRVNVKVLLAKMLQANEVVRSGHGLYALPATEGGTDAL